MCVFFSPVNFAFHLSCNGQVCALERVGKCNTHLGSRWREVAAPGRLFSVRTRARGHATEQKPHQTWRFCLNYTGVLIPRGIKKRGGILGRKPVVITLNRFKTRQTSFDTSILPVFLVLSRSAILCPSVKVLIALRVFLLRAILTAWCALTDNVIEATQRGQQRQRCAREGGRCAQEAAATRCWRLRG